MRVRLQWTFTALVLLVPTAYGEAEASGKQLASLDPKYLEDQEARSAQPSDLLNRIAAFFGAGGSGGGDQVAPQADQPSPEVNRLGQQQHVLKQKLPPPRVGGSLAFGPPPKTPSIPLRGRPPAPSGSPLSGLLPQPPPPKRETQPELAALPSNNFASFASPGGFGNRPGFGPQPPASLDGYGPAGSPSRPPSVLQPVTPNDPWQIAQPANMAQIEDLQVQCEKDMMRVRIRFDRPFYGLVFSKGHFRNANCVHVPSGIGQTQATFDIPLQSCGMTSSINGYSQQTPQGSYIENTIIIQYDPLLQEVWDQARRLRCTWYDFYEKAVTFRPYQVDMLDPVTANFLGDNLRCWMQIQVGKGPQASEVSGIVKIGQTMTMVIGVKDDENKFDMMVRNCVAHDGTRAPIQLVDEKGCVSRPKIMSPFRKIQNFDATANVLSYAYFQAFKFPDSMNVHFQCVVQVCRGACPEPQCGNNGFPIIGNQLPPASSDSYGSPLGQLISSNSNINPRSPSNTVYSDNEDQDSVYPQDLTERLSLSEPGYGDFNKRVGAAGPAALGGRPRALDEDEPEDLVDVKGVENKAKMAEGNDSEVSRRKKRSADQGRILKVTKRDATEMADVETAEQVIQVIAPNDVQFHLPTAAEDRASAEGKEAPEEVQQELVINTNTSPAEAVCIDTTAFIGVTVTFIMVLVIALITIVFLWMRIRILTSKSRKLLQ